MIAFSQLQREFFERLMESQFATAAEIKAAQRKQIAQLVDHARARVPFYRHRLEGLLSPSGGIDWDRWAEVPLLTRTDLLLHRQSMQATAMPKMHGGVLTETTSGSTGPAVTLSRSTLSAVYQSATMFRAHQWHGLDWSKDNLSWAADNKSISDILEVGPVWGPPWLATSTGRSLTLNRLADVGRVMDEISVHAPGYLSARPNNAQFLALESMRQGVAIRLDAVIGFGTAVQQENRADCYRAFGARVISHYSSKEGQHIAYQCPTGTHYHVNDEAVLVEVIDDNGRPCAPGEVGRVVVTQLRNFAQPIIRYEHGDLAVLGEPCVCGRSLTVIDKIVGRTLHLFHFPDGTKVAPIIPDSLRGPLNAQYWQFAQIAPLQIEVRYVPFDGPVPSAEAFHNMAEVVRTRTHRDVAVSFRAVMEIGRAPGGKFIEYVYEADVTN